MLRDKVILVNERDEWLGLADKIAAHRTGLLHRAVSVFVTNSKGDILLQQRADGKYHSAGLWSNACCTHPFPGESTAAAARRRLVEELGIRTPLHKNGSFCYRAQVGVDMLEHELDHIYSGVYDGEIMPDAAEVQAWKWVDEPSLKALLAAQPRQFTAWFAQVYEAWKAQQPRTKKPAPETTGAGL